MQSNRICANGNTAIAMEPRENLGNTGAVIDQQKKNIMSLHERFTQLRRAEPQMRGVVAGRVDVHGGSLKNKKLALQMSKRPTVVAALARGAFDEIKMSAQSNGFSGGYGGGGYRRSFRGRRGGYGGGGGLNRSNSSWGSLSNLSQTGAPFQRSRSRSRGRDRGRGFGRSSSLGRLRRSSSVVSLASNASVRSNRSRGFGRGRGRGRRSSSVNRLYRSASMTSLNSSFRGRGIGRGRGRGGVARGFVDRRNDNRRGRGGFNRGRGGQAQRGSPRGGFRGRGGRGNRGAPRGRGGRGRWTKAPLPDRDTLDKELDQYMSGSRAFLDRELDSYMSQT
ncbi:Hypothetical protein NTJ_11978 [Nesidiocoris tenuis]|uniref:Chromatin target of PRMT1 protein C-terminal domain-containing protein n=1 Tax=Nesidiocoris tenuis TaxID=355587 RepID=A0ABN7B407_9HEMI|nr:Hypothetical protein NTJ_11978 [Nesidiocoris tenuis]